MKCKSLKLRGLLFVFCVVAISISYGQPPNNTKVPQVIPPSPDAAALGKYGSIPVGLHTGVPDISIPIYTIKCGDLEVPISLSYHASGIKVSEVASWVGLGWVLNAGGMVSRSVVGKSDDIGFWSGSIKSENQVNLATDFGYLKGIADNTTDGESDFYHYNFPGHSGKFVYQQNQGNTNPLIIPESPIKIVYGASNFQITDENGNIYKFAIAETMSTTESQVYNSAFNLSEIISADGMDHIYFSYASDNSYTELGWSYTETIGQYGNGQSSTPLNGYHSYDKTPANRYVNSMRLTEINYTNGKVEFVPDFSRSDLPPVRLQEIKIWSKNPNGTFTHRKSYTLGEDYFVAPTGSDKDTYRLKLANLLEKDPAGVVSKGYVFQYEETAILPHRSSLAQDWWGFYNGQTGNVSLIGTESLTFWNFGYTIGAANRNPNPATMQAGMLKKIIYPTGGSTEFIYEPHSYLGATASSEIQVPAASGAIGNTTTLLEQTVFFTPTTSGWARVNTYCSNVTDAVPFYSRVSIRKQNDLQYLLDHRYDPAIYSPFNGELNKDFFVFVIAGNTYELTVQSKGTSTSTVLSGAAFSRATVYYDQVTTGTVATAGGLRVKEVRDYASPDAPPIVKLYKYGAGESGHGILLVPPDGMTSSKQDIFFWYSEVNPGNGYCTKYSEGNKRVITGRPVYDLTSLGGSPVVYGEVAVYEGSLSAPNGKQVFKFDVEIDETTYAPPAFNNGRFQLSNGWKGGDEIYNVVYKGNTNTKIKETTSINTILKTSETIGTKVGWAVSMEGCGFPVFVGNTTCCNDFIFYVFDYPIYSGVKKLTSTKELQYSSATPAKYIETQVDFSYRNLNSNHQQLSTKITLDSDGSTFSNLYWYPADFPTTENFPTLLTKNIVAPVIREETSRANYILGGKVTRLNTDGKPTEIHEYQSLTPQLPNLGHITNYLPTGYVKVADLDYDANKNLNKTQLVNDINTAYLWGYNSTFPTAMITNATASEVAATSFESNDKGNWTYSGATLASATSKTGGYHWRLGSGKNITRSLTAGSYKLEYWAKGTVNLSGGTITAIRTSPADANGWILYEKQVTISSTTTLTMSGGTSAYVDEVRIYPITAQITTYTYDLDSGISSVTDPNNVVTYYEYDSMGRLKVVKDNNRHVVKAFDYHYKGY